MDKIQEMIAEAIENLKNSYAPYSHFNVSAVVLMSSGKTYSGVNVENSAFPVTSCAERSALFHAVSEGERKLEKIVIVGGKNGVIDDYCMPCGMCRQAMREFSNPQEMEVIIAKSIDDYKVFTLEELLPNSFGPEDLPRD